MLGATAGSPRAGSAGARGGSCPRWHGVTLGRCRLRVAQAVGACVSPAELRNEIYKASAPHGARHGGLASHLRSASCCSCSRPQEPGTRPFPASALQAGALMGTCRSCSTPRQSCGGAVATEGMASAHQVGSDGSPSASEQGGDAHAQGRCLPVSRSALPKNDLEIGKRGELQGELGCSTLLSGGSADKHEIPHFSGTHGERGRSGCSPPRSNPRLGRGISSRERMASAIRRQGAQRWPGRVSCRWAKRSGQSRATAFPSL